MSPGEEDENHRVFNGMKILSEYDAEHESLLFSRPVQGVQESHQFVLHKLWVEKKSDAEDSKKSDWSKLVEFETSRLKFIGRGGSLRHADILESRRTLTGTVGTTLDPIMSMRRRLHVPAGGRTDLYV